MRSLFRRLLSLIANRISVETAGDWKILWMRVVDSSYDITGETMVAYTVSVNVDHLGELSCGTGQYAVPVPSYVLDGAVAAVRAEALRIALENAGVPRRESREIVRRKYG